LLGFFAAAPALAEETLTATHLAKGSWSLGGSFSLTTGRSGSRYSLNASLSRFVADNLSIDASMGLLFVSSTFTGTPGLGVSYYFARKDSWAPFVAHSFLASTRDFGDSIQGLTQAGVAFFLSPNVAFKTSANVSYNFRDFSQTIGLTVAGGFAYYF
jgi:hypothetical protein